jgi:hypothetical protein
MPNLGLSFLVVNVTQSKSVVFGRASQIQLEICSAATCSVAGTMADVSEVVPEQWWASLTETGRRLLAGEVDWVEINGLDRWVGGIHLKSVGGSVYRYAGREV